MKVKPVNVFHVNEDIKLKKELDSTIKSLKRRTVQKENQQKVDQS